MPRGSGNHTWELIVRYHRCPHCGNIIESREDYEYRMGKYVKEIECWRCGKPFVETKAEHATFGPLLGKDQPAEIDWS